ncbi:MAG: DNA polymerase III subunit psi [Bacteroidetes bacterium]|nr:DNA polymerase III subunit psi [Bacteroidota bacterium]
MNSALFESIFSEQLFSIAAPPTIVINQSWEKIGNEERNLLSKILGAIRHSLDSVSIKHQSMLDLSTWIEKPKQVIYFGDPVKGLQPYEVLEANGVSIVTSESLSDLLKNDSSRKNLWQALKKQFSI